MEMIRGVGVFEDRMAYGDGIESHGVLTDAFASTHRRSVECVDRRADDQAKTTDEPRAAQGAPPLHNQQAVSTKTKQAQSGVDPLEPFQPA